MVQGIGYRVCKPKPETTNHLIPSRSDLWLLNMAWILLENSDFCCGKYMKIWKYATKWLISIARIQLPVPFKPSLRRFARTGYWCIRCLSDGKVFLSL